MADQQAADQQLALAMAYSSAYSMGLDNQQEFTTAVEEDTRHQREGSKDSDHEESDGRRRGGSFERSDLRSRESRRFSPYPGNRDQRTRTRMPRDNRVFVSNMPYTVRWQELKDHMKTIGEVAFAEIFEDDKGRSKGCGVVEFRSKEDAEKAIKDFNGQDFNGRSLLVREVRAEEDGRMHRSKLRGNTISQSPQHTPGGMHGLGGLGALPNLLGMGAGAMSQSHKNDPASCTVFVSNLDYKVNWQKLKDAFRCAGNVLRADVLEDDAKKSKGFATVQFEMPMEALNAVNMLNGQMLMDRPMHIRMDRDAPLMKQQSSGGGSQGMRNLSGANPLGAAAAVNPMALLQILQSLQGLTALAQLTNFGGNLGGNFGGNLGGNLGGNFGGGMGSPGSSQGMGASGSAVGGGTGMMPDMSSGGGLGALGNLGNLGALGNLGGMMGQLGGASSGSMGMAGSSSQGESTGKQVFVRNLPWKYTWQDLKDKFRSAGKVTRADILTESTGRSKGCGIVVFETREEAQRAISMYNGASFDGREIDVRLDRFA